MAAIELRSSWHRLNRRSVIRSLALPALAVFAKAAQPRDVRATIIYLSSALANGNPSDAMTVFAKTSPGYRQLLDYFSVLTTSYEIASEVEISDETTTDRESDVEATWTLNLTSLSTKATDRRVVDVKIRLQRTKPGNNSPWQIAEFVPVDLFNPQFRENSKTG